MTGPTAPNWDAASPMFRDLLGNREMAGLGGIIQTGHGISPRALIPDLLRLYPHTRPSSPRRIVMRYVAGIGTSPQPTLDARS